MAENNKEKRKRYKARLDPYYQHSMVSLATRRTWDRKCEAGLAHIRKRNIHEDTCATEASFSSSTYLNRMTDFVEEFPYEAEPNENNVLLEDTLNENEATLSENEVILCENEAALSENETETSKESVYSDNGQNTSLQRTEGPIRNNKIMFKEAGLTVDDVMTMVAGYSLRFRLSIAARKNLIELLKVCAGPNFNEFTVSNYYFETRNDPPDDKIVFHFYCTKCCTETYRSTKKQFKRTTVFCESCCASYNITLSCDNYFLTIDLRYQIELLLKADNVRLALFENLMSNKSLTQRECIRDICNGELYESLIKSMNNILSYNGSTDGAPVGNKTKRSIWPLSFILNDLPANIRFKYILLGGIMVVKHEPTHELMNLYIQSFIQQTIDLQDNGILLRMTSDDLAILFKPIVLCFSTDSVTRPLLQYRLKFNGYFGCSFCYQKGTYINGMRYPFENISSEIRTDESHMRDVQEFSISGSLIRSRGVKGQSVFNSLSHFNMVWGFPFDYMHTILLGTVKHLWELWVKIPEVGLSRQIKKEIDKRLLQIQPPYDLHKLPHTILNYTNYKAKDWRSWHLYYCIPVCLGYVSQKYIRHYALLVKCTFILSKTEITQNELDECEKIIMIFVAVFEMLYGKEMMRFNVHMLLHAVKSVRMSGPLWATSTFPFENNIYFLKRLINGPKGIEQQIAKKSLQILSYIIKIDNSSAPNNVKDYSKQLFSKGRFVKSAITIDEVTLFNKKKSFLLNNDTVTHQSFGKCLYKKQVYETKHYSRFKKWNNSVIQLKCKKIVQISDIIIKHNKCHFAVTVLTVEELVLYQLEENADNIMDKFIGDIEMPHIWKVYFMDDAERLLVPIDDILCKMVLIDLGEEKFVCNMPNVIEID